MVQRILLTITLAGLVGCGIDEFGVSKVNFELTASTLPEAPAGLDGTAVAAMLASHGSVAVDTHSDTGVIEGLGLPALPDGLSYGVILQYASEEREALGGGSGGGGGHSHGALGLPDPVLASGDEELTARSLGELEEEMTGHWELNFTSAAIGDSEMGALRAAMIMLQPATGPAVMIMSGEIEIETGAPEAGGHSHGA